MFLCFMARKYILLATSGNKIVEMQNADPCSISFWKRKFSFCSGFKIKKKKMVVELQVYPGHKTPSSLVEDTTQYLLYKYTPFKDESEG